jgi:hypothetical protein
VKAETGADAAKAEKASTPPPTTKKKRKKRRTSDGTERVRDREPPPPPPPPPRRVRRARTDEDDLLGAVPENRRRVAPPPSEPDLPRQLDDSDVLGVLRKNRNDVRNCLVKQKAADPSLDGTMTVKIVIKKTGRPSRVTVAPSKFKSSVVGKCVASEVKGWRFPKFSGPNMPIDFPVHVRGN